MKMSEKPPQYQTYILRFWEERNAERQTEKWRFTLEDPANNIRHGFDSLDDIIAFLRTQLAHTNPEDH